MRCLSRRNAHARFKKEKKHRPSPSVFFEYFWDSRLGARSRAGRAHVACSSFFFFSPSRDDPPCADKGPAAPSRKKNRTRKNLQRAKRRTPDGGRQSGSTAGKRSMHTRAKKAPVIRSGPRDVVLGSADPIEKETKRTRTREKYICRPQQSHVHAPERAIQTGESPRETNGRHKKGD